MHFSKISDQVIEMFNRDGLKESEIARIVGITEDQVHQILADFEDQVNGL